MLLRVAAGAALVVTSLDLVWMGEAPESRRAEGLAPGEYPWAAGMAFWAPYRYQLSKHYLANVAQVRRPIVVMLPAAGAPCSWCIDAHPTGQPDGAWTVTVDLDSLVVGQKPRITCSPSLHAVGIWHGWLTDGALTEA